MSYFYDAHCHYNFIKNKKYDNFIIAAVSMDYETSVDTLSISDKKILKGVGIHPWRVYEESIERVLPLVNKADFIGEVGLDFRFAKAPKDLQIQVFKRFIEISEGKTLNVHALDAWREAFELLVKHDVKRAIFHWYTGPIDLLKDIEYMGYFITINPSVTFQKKHQAVLEKADINIILTESDGGYEYRGRLLEPIHILEALEYISRLKEIEISDLNRKIESNFKKAFNIV